MKVSSQKKNMRASFARKSGITMKTPRACINCKTQTVDGHFVPPSLGDIGFFTCKPA